jgi:hypothetical protein
MMNRLRNLEEEISAWPHVSIHPHRFGGREFRFGEAGLGHMHSGGMVDIPFPHSIRNAVLEEGLAEHRWVPNSGWITFRVHNEGDLKHARWLMGLSYLRYALRISADPRRLSEQESETLHLSSQFKFLLEVFVPETANLSTEAAISISRFSTSSAG